MIGMILGYVVCFSLLQTLEVLVFLCVFFKVIFLAVTRCIEIPPLEDLIQSMSMNSLIHQMIPFLVLVDFSSTILCPSWALVLHDLLCLARNILSASGKNWDCAREWTNQIAFQCPDYQRDMCNGNFRKATLWPVLPMAPKHRLNAEVVPEPSRPAQLSRGLCNWSCRDGDTAVAYCKNITCCDSCTCCLHQWWPFSMKFSYHFYLW